MFFTILRLSSSEPRSLLLNGDSPLSIRFAPVSLKIELCEAAVTLKISHLRALRSLLTTWLLLLTGDVEVNPGPRCRRYPCGVRCGPVRKNQRGVQSCVCLSWLHTRCIGVSNEQYLELQQSADPLCCKKCQSTALPFYDVSDSDSVFNTSAVSLVSTSGQPLDTISEASLPLTSSQFPAVFQQLTILYANCRSILPKIDHLEPAHSPHLIAICETWLDETISNDKLFIPDFSRDRDRHGGGIAMFIHESLSFSIHQTHSTIELQLVDLKTRRSRFSCGLYYRPPSVDPSDLTSLEAALEELPPLMRSPFSLWAILMSTC